MDKNYLANGFDKFLTKKKRANAKTTEFLEDEISLLIKQFSGGQIAYSKSISPDGNMTIDWEKKKLTVSDGARDRVIIGYIAEEGVYGIRVIDSTGATQLDETY